jgi:hypothetical protein
MDHDDRLARIERAVLSIEQKLDATVGSIEEMVAGLAVMARRINDIYHACCGEQPPSELAQVLKELVAAVARTGDLVQALIDRRRHDG